MEENIGKEMYVSEDFLFIMCLENQKDKTAKWLEKKLRGKIEEERKRRENLREKCNKGLD